MNALFWLLALASVASVLPNLYKVGKGQHVLLAPLLLCVGYALSPLGLGFVESAAVRSMQPAVQLFITWIAVSAGMYVPHPRLWLRYRAFWSCRLGKSALMALWVSLGIGALLVMTQLFVAGHRLNELLQEESATLSLTWGFLLVGSQMQLRIWQQGLLAGVALGVVSDLTLNQLQLLCVVVVGCAVTATLLQRWAHRATQSSHEKHEHDVVFAVVLIGIASLCAGLSHQLDLPHVCTGFTLGFCLSLMSSRPFEQRRWVAQTAIPAQLVVIVLVGLMLQISWAWLIWGMCLGVVLVLMRFAKTASSLAFEMDPWSLSYGYASCSTAFAAALLFAGGRAHAHAPLLLAITAIAASFSDLIIWCVVQYRNRKKYVA